MKTKSIANLATSIAVCGILFLSSCAKEEDIAPDDSTIDDVSKYKGSWSVAENSTDFGKTVYNVTIVDAGSGLTIAYLYNAKQKTNATVNGNSMNIPKQTIDGNEVSGSGILENSKRLTLKYFVKSTSTHIDTVNSVLTK